MGRASAGGCEAVRGGGGTRAVPEGGTLNESAAAARRRGRRRAQAWCGGAHSRFAEMSDVGLHLYLPSEHRNLKHEKAGTIVTSLATPCFRPPTVEATWVP